MNRNGFNFKQYNERGYYYEKENDTLICTIAMGEKPSGGYYIEIKKVKIKGNSSQFMLMKFFQNRGT
jgi:hypothetical protein